MLLTLNAFNEDFVDAQKRSTHGAQTLHLLYFAVSMTAVIDVTESN